MATSAIAAAQPSPNRLVVSTPFYYGWVVWALAALAIIASAPGQAFTVSLFIDHYIAEFFGGSLGIAINAPFAGLGAFIADFNETAAGGRTIVSTLFSAGTVIAALCLTWIGRQMDRRGNRVVGAIGGATFAAALVASSLIVGPVMIFVSFLLLRLLGMGTLFLSGQTAIARWWIVRRGWVMGLALVAFALFQRAYLPALESLINQVGWRQAWVILGGFVGLGFVPLWIAFMRNTPEQYGLLPDGRETDHAPNQETEPEATEHNYTLAQARSLPIFWIFLLGRIGAASMGSGLIFHLVSVFADVGHSAAVAASTFGSIALFNAGITLMAGRLIRHIRPGLFIAVQLIFMIGALLLSQTMTETWMLTPFALCFGLVMAFGGTFDGTVWADLFGRTHHGAIRGFSATAQVTGTAIGPVIWAFSRDSFGSYTPVVLAGIVALSIPLVASLFTSRPRDLEPEAEAAFAPAFTNAP